MPRTSTKGKGIASEPKKDNMKWTDDMDEIFIDALLEEQVNGNRPDGTFTTQAYTNMMKKCTEKFGFPVDKTHLKNRIKTLKHNFGQCHDLFKGLSGFAWNPVTKLFEAEPEAWEPLIKANATAGRWKYTRIQCYDKLYELFAKDRATGEGAVSAKEKVQQWAAEDGNIDLNNVYRFDDIDLDMNDPLSPTSTAGSSKSSKRKAAAIDVMERQIDVISSGIENIAEVMRDGNAIAEKGILIAEKGLEIAEKGRPHCYSEAEVFNELVSIDVPYHLQLDAYLFLMKSPAKMRAFFGVPVERRKELLFKMMYGSNDLQVY